MSGERHPDVCDLAVSRGWISPELVAELRRRRDQAEASGVSFAIEQALLESRALSADRIHALLAETGRAIGECPSCRRVWNAPTGRPAWCPADGAPLGPTARLDSAGRIDPGSPAGQGLVAPVAGTPAARDSTRTLPISSRQELASSTAGSPPAGDSESGDGAGYEILGEIGRGGMGVILRARDTRLGRDVAMKTLAAGGDAGLGLRFLEEARVTGQLEHPNIVPVHEVGRHGGQSFFTMKLVRGRSLAELIAAAARGESELSIRRGLDIVLKVCDAVAFAHAHGVLHRDLKPGNIMVGEFGEVLVMDWGLARVMAPGDREADEAADLTPEALERLVESRVDVSTLRDESEGAWTIEGAACGTPGYMSPEQLDGDTRLGPRTDVYSLGAILFELLTLERAWQGRPMEIARQVFDGRIPDPEAVESERGIPPELAAITRKAMAIRPADRYRDVPALAADIEAFLENRSVSARRDPLWTRARKWARRNIALTAGGLVGLIAGMVFLISAVAMPATLRIRVEDWQQRPTVLVDRKPQTGRLVDGFLELRIWPPRTIELGLQAALERCDDRILRLRSGELRELSPAPVRRTGTLDLTDSDASFFAELTPLDGIGEPSTRRGPVSARVPTGRYRVRLQRANAFDRVVEIEIKEDETVQVEVDLESAVVNRRQFSRSITDFAVADFDQDLRPDLVLSFPDAVERRTLPEMALVWRRELRFTRKALRRGGQLEVTDLEGDGRLELICHAEDQVHILDAISGETLDAFDQPDATVAAVDLDGDGLLELVVGTGYSGIRALERTGAPRWTLPTAKYAWSRRPLAFELPDAGRIVLGTTAPPLTFYAARADTGALVWSRHLSEIQSAPYGILHRRRGPPIIVHAVPQGFAARHVATGEAAWPARKLGRRIRAFYGGEPGTPPGLLAQLNDGGFQAISEDGEPLWCSTDEPLAAPGAGDPDADGELEWLLVSRPPEGRDGFRFQALRPSGERILERHFRLGADSRFSGLGPLVFDLWGDGRPHALVIQRRSIGLFRLHSDRLTPPRDPEASLVEPYRARHGLYLRDLDGDGRLEQLRHSARQGLVVRGSVSWTDAALRELLGVSSSAPLQILEQYIGFADFDGDGVRDLCFDLDTNLVTSKPGNRLLVVLSGRGGRPLALHPMPGGLVSAPVVVSHPGGPILLAARSGRLVALRPGPRPLQPERLWTVKANLTDSAATPTGDGQSFVHGNLTELVQRRLSDGEVIRVTPIPDRVTSDPVRLASGLILVGTAQGVVRIFDGRLQPRSHVRLFRHHIPDIIPHPDRPAEVLVVCAQGELAILHPETLRAERRYSEYDRMSGVTWSANWADVDEDGEEEVVTTTYEGRIAVLDGRTLRLRFSTERVRRPGAYSPRLVPPQLGRWSETGLTLIFDCGGTAALNDLARHLELAKRTLAQPEPGLRLLALERAIAHGRTARVAELLPTLDGTIFAERARLLAVIAGHAGVASQSNTRSISSLQLRMLQEQGRPSEQLLSEVGAVTRQRPGRIHGLISGAGARRDVVVAMLRRTVGDDVEVAGALLRHAEGRLALGQEKEAELELENAARVFPSYPPLVGAYAERVVVRAIRLNRAFDRSRPLAIIGRALTIIEHPRLYRMQGRLMTIRGAGTPQQILAAFDKAVSLHGATLARSLAFRAEHLARTGEVARARRDIQQALEFARKDGLVFAVCASACMELKEPAGRVLQLMNLATQLGIDDELNYASGFYWAKAVVELQSGQPAEACRTFERFRAVTDNALTVLTYAARLGEALVRGGRRELGLPLLREVEQLQPDRLTPPQRQLLEANSRRE